MMRRRIPALTAAIALSGAAVSAPAGAEVELFGNGWRDTTSGVVHCTADQINQVVCDRIGPAYAWYLQGVGELWWPEWCRPVELITGVQGYTPARLRLAGVHGLGCGLGVYPSQTQAFAAWAGSPPVKVAYEGALSLRPQGVNGGGGGPAVYLTVEQINPNGPASSRMLDIVIH